MDKIQKGKLFITKKDIFFKRSGMPFVKVGEFSENIKTYVELSRIISKKGLINQLSNISSKVYYIMRTFVHPSKGDSPYSPFYTH